MNELTIALNETVTWGGIVGLFIGWILFDIIKLTVKEIRRRHKERI